MQRLRDQGKKVVLDIDDLLDNPTSSHPELEMLLHCKETVPRCIQAANHVVVSTQSLKDAYRHLNPNITVIENSLSTEHIPESYRPGPRRYHTTFTVGWCGGRTHLDDQFEFAFGLDKFLDGTTHSRAHFKGICPQFLTNKHGARVFFDPRMTHYLDYHQWIGTLPWDACLVGLVAHPFNDAKSDLRFIEMARHKIPVIASPRASFKPHGDAERLMLASTNNSFRSSLNLLYQDANLKKEIADRAFDYVMSERLDRHAAAKWAEVLESL